MGKRITILGVPVDAVTLGAATDVVAAMLTDGKQHHIMTPNPEMMVEAKKNPEFLSILQTSDLNVPDGAGLLWAAKRQDDKLPERVTGVDLLQSIGNILGERKAFLLGAAPGIAEKAAHTLLLSHPSMHIAGTFAGSPREEDEASIIERINLSGASILFVAYGAPKQDLWIRRNLSSMPNVKVAMGVGGAFDFLAGAKSRAPKWMQSAGIEWLWRLLQEPRRIGRIFTAVIRFPMLVLRDSPRRS